MLPGELLYLEQVFKYSPPALFDYFGGRDGEQRAPRRVQDGLGDGPEDHAGYTMPAVGSHDDEVGPAVPGRLQDLESRVAAKDRGFAPETALSNLRCQRVEAGARRARRGRGGRARRHDRVRARDDMQQLQLGTVPQGELLRPRHRTGRVLVEVDGAQDALSAHGERIGRP